mmetsp:Transcript_772/g.1314  ORF Transcript_772/g.1314 Transcript_772/m.1314 type:complete len:836 (-) Transcript_772:91-2598(-)
MSSSNSQTKSEMIRTNDNLRLPSFDDDEPLSNDEVKTATLSSSSLSLPATATEVNANGNLSNENPMNLEDHLKNGELVFHGEHDADADADSAEQSGFPTIEVTVDSSSCMSASDYDEEECDGRKGSSATPISPLTPSMAERAAISSSSLPHTLNNEAQHLMNVLEKVSSKASIDYDDVDMGIPTPFSSTGMRISTRDVPGREYGLNIVQFADVNPKKVLESQKEDDSSGTTPTRNQRAAPSNHLLHRMFQPYYRHDETVPVTSPVSIASSYQQQEKYQEYPQPPYLNKIKKTFSTDDPTLHAQTFVLALAFFAIWSPQNLMAPNLTQMASYFHFTTEQRDLYLGANIAFATGVLSLPVQTLLGFLADVVPSRKQLFAYTVMGGGIASIFTGYSKTYTQLYFCRFLCGGCMSGSVPIAFSMLGDLFDAKDRNVASSGLTAMMGAGILFGQVYAGAVGEAVGWKRPFYLSGALSIFTALMVLYFVREPVRGGKERVLQEMIANGTKYDRKLTVHGFLHAMTKNKTNVILMLQSFSTSVPWGIIFTFLNDYFAQEQGMSVAASTILIVWFGLGSAAGGVIGGTIGTKLQRINRAFLPLFMALSTALGIVPFLGLLDLKLNGASFLAVFLAFIGPCVANLPSVNVRPCILNVNPPETRGAAMTAANLMVNVGRGAGPSIITLSQQFFYATRQYSFNLSLIVFWSLTTLLLIILAKTLPYDQDAMDAELERYAASKISKATGDEEGTEIAPAAFVEEIYHGSNVERAIANFDDMTLTGEESIISIEDRITSFDAAALQESWTFIGGALREIAEASHIRNRPNYQVIMESEGDDMDTTYSS